MRRKEKGSSKALQAAIKSGLEERVAAGGTFKGRRVKDSYAVLNYFEQKYGLPEDVVNLIIVAYGDKAEELFEEAYRLSDDGETEVRSQALRLHLAYGWPLEALVPMVKKYGAVEADLQIQASGLSSEEVADRVLEFGKQIIASGFKGERIYWDDPRKIPGLRLENIARRPDHPRDRPELGGHYDEHNATRME